MNSLVRLATLLTFHFLVAIVTPSSALTMKLVHYNSIHSPFFNPKATLEEHFEIIFQMSIKRLAYLREQILGAKDIETQITGGPRQPLFMVTLEIGNPSKTQLLAMDTGSSLLWVYWGEDTTTPYFPTYSPQMSTSYKNVINCDHYLCHDLGLSRTCSGQARRCTYYVKYLSAAITSGQLGQESFVFSSKNGTQYEVNDIVFGCSRTTGNDLPFSGVLGLAPKQVSIVTQLGTPFFSYFIGNMSDSKSDNNVLTLGRSGKKSMQFTTPLFIDGVHYYVELEAFGIGPHIIYIEFSSDSRGAIIDSGAAITILEENAYDLLEEIVTERLDPQLRRCTETSASLSKQICYYGHMYRDLNKFPNVTLFYRGMVGAVLMGEHLFKQQSDNVFCTTFVSSKLYQADYSLIGVNFQQFMLMEFDIEHRSLGISQ